MGGDFNAVKRYSMCSEGVNCEVRSKLTPPPSLSLSLCMCVTAARGQRGGAWERTFREA